MSSIMLVSAVLASMVLGVMIAYGSCMAMFRVFRIHAKQVAADRAAQAGMTVTAQVIES